MEPGGREFRGIAGVGPVMQRSSFLAWRTMDTDAAPLQIKPACPGGTCEWVLVRAVCCVRRTVLLL